MAKGIGASVGVLLWSAASIAGTPLEYGADPAAAAWRFEGSRTACRLTHEIPNFGEARFMQEAGRSLAFDLSAWRIVLKGDMDVSAETPAWLVPHPARSRSAACPQDRRTKSLPRRYWRTRCCARCIAVSSRSSCPMTWTFRCPRSDSGPRMTHTLAASRSCCPRRSSNSSAVRSFLRRINLNPSDAGKARLDLLADYIHADRSVKHIQVEGHTDSSGRERKNRLLSEQRAKAVVDYLVAAGLDVETIDTRFHGSRFPVASNKTEEGRAQNRRVTVRLERQHTKVAAR